jgi:3,4-dihydroxy-2-butanone 4-phosphate synthase
MAVKHSTVPPGVGSGRFARLARVCRAIQAARRGQTVIIFDDKGRENEGDYVCHASMFTEEVARAWQKRSSGLTCVSMTQARADRLRLSRLYRRGKASTPFMDPVDHMDSVTGISARDRSLTVQALGSPMTEPLELEGPGHVFPLQASPGLLFDRCGHTEASVLLMKMAGMSPVAAITEIMSMKRVGEVARMDELMTLGCPLISNADLMEYMPLWGKRVVHVTLKVAMTLDGKLGRVGSNTDITRSIPECRSDVIRLRQRHDAVVVGGNTARIDCPRLEGAKKRLALSSRARPIRFDACFSQPTIALALANAHLVEDVRTVMVESGPTLSRAILAEGVVNTLVVYIAPRMLGSVGTLPLEVPDNVCLTLVSTERMGDAVKCVYDVSSTYA